MHEQKTHGAEAAVRLRTTTDEMLAEVERLPTELINWIPGEGVWSVMDILCHIREFIPFWTNETVRITQRPEEQWGRDHTDTGRLAAVTNTAELRLQDVVADIRRHVQQSSETLSRLSDADLSIEATSMNPRWGLKPAAFVVDQLLVGHAEKHLGQIRRNAAQFDQARAKVE